MKGGTSEAQVVGLVTSLFYQAREARRPLVQEWKRNYRILNNDDWKPAAEPWLPNPSIPKIWPVIASLAAWSTDQRPRIEAVPTMPPFSPYADFFQGLGEQMTALLNTSWLLNGLARELSMVLWDMYTYRVGYTKVGWEPWLADGHGDATMRRVDPFQIYPDPFARNEADLSYIIQAHMMSVDDADRAFPGAAKLIGSNAGLLDAEPAPHRLSEQNNDSKPRYNLKPLGANTQQGMGRVRGGESSGQITSPVMTVLECWVRSHKHEKQKDGSTRTTEDWTVIVVGGNRVLMHENAWDVNAFGSHPFDKLCLFSTGEWYGPSLVTFLGSPQESINRILKRIEQNIDLVGNPMLVEGPASAEMNRRITNRPGARLNARPSDVAWMNPPQMHPQMALTLLQYYAAEIESISGMSAIMRGFSPTGRNAQGVIDSVQDSAFVRVRATLREIEHLLRSAGTKMMATIAEFYTEPRMATILGGDGEKTSLVLRKNHFYDPREQQPMRFSLLADGGSELETSRQALSARAAQYWGMQLIDREEALKAVRWPNWKTVSDRVDHKEMQGAMGAPTQRSVSRS